MNDVILHAFDWPFDKISEHAEMIAKIGYGSVLISPPLYSRDDEGGKAWWNRYQPKDYRIVRSFLGDKASVERTIASLHRHGVRIYADVVFNHMANEQRSDRLCFPGQAELERYRQQRSQFEKDKLYGNLDEGLFVASDFNLDGNIENWMDAHEATEHSLSGLPDLDMAPRVIDQQRACLRALNAMGFDGYRVDAVKHLPDAHIRTVFETPEMAGKFIFGESLTSNDGEERLFLWPLLNNTAMAFYDFPLHETLRKVFSQGGSMRELVDPASYGQALPWNRAVTFGVTHDMPNNDGFRGTMLSKQDEFLANVYLLGRDGGVPMVYSDLNPSAQAYPQDTNRWADSWRRPDITGMVAFHNATHGLGQRSLCEGDTHLVFARGDRGIVAINKSDRWQSAEFSTQGLRLGKYRCMIHGHHMEMTWERFAVAIPPRQAQMWLAI